MLDALFFIMTLLSVDNLTLSARYPIVQEVSFRVEEGRIVALVGESGSGKSMIASAVMGLLPLGVHRRAGRILFDGKRLDPEDESTYKDVRGSKIAIVFQEAMSALNPVIPVGRQIAEVITTHTGAGRKEAGATAVHLLESVKIRDPERSVSLFPHQLSGGMRQRVMLAMALAGNPKLIIADEPTTALDVTVQTEILSLLLSLMEERGFSLLFITHDLAVVAHMAHRTVIIYAGRVMEAAGTRKLFENPCHPYTRALFESRVTLGKKGEPLPSIPGHVPSPSQRLPGCPFAPRCAIAEERCSEDLPPLEERGDRACRCFLRKIDG